MFMRQSTGWSKKTRDIITIALILLTIGNVIPWAMYGNVVRRDNRMRTVLIARGQGEISTAREMTQLLSRTGGSHTSTQLAQLRQHLYSIQTLNAITGTLYGANRGIVDHAQVSQALDIIASCESRLLAGQTIDIQLGELWTLLQDLQAAVDRLAE